MFQLASKASVVSAYVSIYFLCLLSYINYQECQNIIEICAISEMLALSII